MSAAGIGKLSPNVMMLGFMHSWKERAVDDMVSYYNMIHDAFTYNYGVVILNAPKGNKFTLRWNLAWVWLGEVPCILCASGRQSASTGRRTHTKCQNHGVAPRHGSHDLKHSNLGLNRRPSTRTKEKEVPNASPKKKKKSKNNLLNCCTTGEEETLLGWLNSRISNSN